MVENVQPIVQELYKDVFKHASSLTHSLNNVLLPGIYFDGFDDEQIWQQIEMLNNQVFQGVLKVANSLERKTKINGGGASLFQIVDDASSKIVDNIYNQEGVDNDISFSDDECLISLEKKMTDDINSFDDGSSVTEGSLNEESSEEECYNSVEEDTVEDFEESRNTSKSLVDDNFFKLSEMSEWLDQEDKRVEEDEEDESDVDEVDIFSNVTDVKDKGEEFVYNDFFDPPQSYKDGEKSLSGGKNKILSHNKKVSTTDDEENVSDDSEDANSVDDEDAELDDDKDDNSESSDDKEEAVNGTEEIASDAESSDDSVIDEDSPVGCAESYTINGNNLQKLNSKINSNVKSSYEKKQERLQRHIVELEERAVSEKPWQMLGESVAALRPEQALLSEALQFDRQKRAAPLLTADLTKSLEALVVQRIKDKAFDDVERKIRKDTSIHEFKERIKVDEEKSKLSLAEIYEKEFTRQTKDEEEVKEDPLKVEVTNLMTQLFDKLDALCHSRYQPRVPKPEVTIISQLPSIALEEVLPSAVAEDETIAPQEIKMTHRQDMKDAEERTDTDKKRAQRKRKVRQRHDQKRREIREKSRAALAAGDLAGGKNVASNERIVAKERVKKLTNAGVVRMAKPSTQKELPRKKLKIS